MTNKLRAQHNAIAVLAALLSVVTIGGCRSRSTAEGTFDKSFSVDGPVHLQVTSGSGTVTITTGAAGEVHIHGDVSANAWSEQSVQRRVDELRSNPPITQQGNSIHVGESGSRSGDVSVDYTIVVPADTELQSNSGSGDLEVTGIKGPANFTLGSGSVTASNIGGDVQMHSGSGDVELSNIEGQITGSAGSGGVKFANIKGPIRMQTGSGDIEVSNPSSSVEVQTGSGGVDIKNASGDVRVRASSGDVEIQGNPNATSYWDIHTSSGDVILDVSAEASLRLYAHTSSGDIDANIPISMEGTAVKHELRARLGDGKARVEVETGSGDITLK